MANNVKALLIQNLLRILREREGNPDLEAPQAITALVHLKVPNGTAQRLLDPASDVRIGTAEEVARRLGVTIRDLLSTFQEQEPLSEKGAIRFAALASKRVPEIDDAIRVVVTTLATLTPSRWSMVRSALEQLPGHAEMVDEVAENVLLLLQAPPAKHHA